MAIGLWDIFDFVFIPRFGYAENAQNSAQSGRSEIPSLRGVSLELAIHPQKVSFFQTIQKVNRKLGLFCLKTFNYLQFRIGTDLIKQVDIGYGVAQVPTEISNEFSIFVQTQIFSSLIRQGAILK